MEPLYVPFQMFLKWLALSSWEEFKGTEKVSLNLGSPLTPQKGQTQSPARTMANAHWQLLRPGRAQTLLDLLLPAHDSTGKLERNKVHAIYSIEIRNKVH